MASQIPLTPKNFGRTNMAMVMNKKVRRKESTAEIFPLEREVNSAEAAMFMPMKRNAGENKRRPLLAMPWTEEPSRVKPVTITSEKSSAAAKTSREKVPTRTILL